MTRDERKKALDELAVLNKEIRARLSNIEDALNVTHGAFDIALRFERVSNISVSDAVLKRRIQTLKDALRVKESAVPAVRVNWLRRHMQIIEGAKGMNVSLMLETSILAKKEKRVEKQSISALTGIPEEDIALSNKPFNVSAFYGNTALRTMKSAITKAIATGETTHQLDIMGANFRKSSSMFPDLPLINGDSTTDVFDIILSLSDREIGAKLYSYWHRNPSVRGSYFSAVFYSSDSSGYGSGLSTAWLHILSAFFDVTPQILHDWSIDFYG